jgi:phosphopantothenoylcysteine decarboxylase/phosphopantothenate--cysteine ligase
MNSAMWEKKSVQRNIATLRADGCHFVDPKEGWQSCRRTGMGRMAEPAEIEVAIDRLFGSA